MAKDVFCTSINRLTEKINSSSLSKEKTYFFLMKNRKKTDVHEVDTIEYYDGPIHLLCVFSSLQNIKDFIKGMMPNGVWISQYDMTA